MKNVLLACLTLFSLTSKAQFVSIPDPIIRNHLISLFPSCFNTSQQMDTTCASITTTEVLDLGSLFFTNLEGIQYFDSLRNLDLSHNNLTSINTLPSSLDTLICNYNQLVSLPDMPNLSYLNCANNSISILPNIPNIITLNCESNQLTTIPGLSNVYSLRCGGNQLTTLPSLPNVRYLYCYGNKLTSLNDFPNLLYLSCRYNRLKSLPTFPNTLIELWCDHNLLFKLPSLPNSLQYLYCGTNFLTELPALPDNLISLYCEGNRLLDCLPKLPMNLSSLIYNGTGIKCIPNNTNFYSGILCVDTCVSRASCAGLIFFDLNLNNTYEKGIDILLPNWNVTNSRKLYGTSGYGGDYYIKLDTAKLNIIKVNPGLKYMTTNPANYSITPSIIELVGNHFNFAVQPIPNIQDLSVQVFQGVARPGFDQGVELIVRNEGTKNMVNTTIKLRKPSLFNYHASIPAITAQHGDTLIWDNVDLVMGQSKKFQLTLKVPLSAMIGDTFKIESWILPISGDTMPADNYWINPFIVSNSWDPNDKHVNKTQLLTTELDQELVYTVRFQNTGNDTALNVIVRDVLDENLDISTFRMLGSSHVHDYSIRENGTLEVLFIDINLVDSFTNEPESHGYFRFAIKPKQDLQGGTTINNYVGIYFDFNAPVITNNVTTYILWPTKIDDVNEISASVYPNPTNNAFRIDMSEKNATLSIFNLQGNLLFNKKITNQSLIDVSQFSDGVYIGKIESEKGSKVFKIIKQ